MNVLEATRRNHALEHATISILVSRQTVHPPIAGNATPGGFYVYGKVETDELESSVAEALRRMAQGETGLAVSPFCGTNLVVGALLVAAVTAAAMDEHRGVRGLPRVFLSTLGALVAAKPLGRLVQQYITTSPEVAGLEVLDISRWRLGSFSVHKVQTRFRV